MPGNYASFSSELRQEFHDITGEIATAGPDINIRSISAFSHAHDFNRLYMAKENGYSILGIIEKLYDDYYQDDRNFMGVAYTGVSGVDCDTITSVDTNAFCDNTGSQVIVLEKNSNEDFRYWNDLTAMLRFLG